MTDQKYVEVPGGSSALYNGDAIVPGCRVVLTEGLLDALAVEQQVGDLVVAVATGSTTRCRQVKWIARLALAERVLVAFDADQAGEEAAAYWLRVLPNAKRWRPWWGDPNQLMIDGVDLRTWLLPALHQEQEVAPGAQTGGQREAADKSVSDAISNQSTDPEVMLIPEEQPRLAPPMLTELESELERLLSELGKSPGTGREFARPDHPGYETYRRFCELERLWMDATGRNSER